MPSWPEPHPRLKIVAMLQQKLAAAGYQVRLIEVSRDKPHELLESYASVDAQGADAIVDMAIVSVGYATEHPMLSPHWRPASQIKVTVVDSAKHETIFSDKYMYGYHNPFMSGTDLDAPKTCHFKDKQALFGNSQLLLDGMHDSLKAVADRVVMTLKQ